MAVMAAKSHRRADEGRAEAPAPVAASALSKRFGDSVLAVDTLDLVVGAGQVFGLLGPNGAGKTTLLRMLLGLIRPTSGSAHVLGERMRPGHPVLKRVGALVEGPAFVPHWTGSQNLKAYWKAGGNDWEEADWQTALDIAGLGAALERKVQTYSKGMEQRLAIAQALLNRPELLILDEPTVGLDPHEMREIRSLLGNVANSGATVLLSSHILGEVEQVCTHAAVMAKGHLVTQGTVEQLTGAATTAYLELDDREVGIRVLKAIPGLTNVAAEGNGLSVTLNGASRATVVAELVRAGLGVETVTSRHRLEDAFLDLVRVEA